MFGDFLLSAETHVKHFESILQAVERREGLLLLGVESPHFFPLERVDVGQVLDPPFNAVQLVGGLVFVLRELVLQVD